MEGEITQQKGTARAAAQPFLAPAVAHVTPLPFFARELAELVR